MDQPLTNFFKEFAVNAFIAVNKSNTLTNRNLINEQKNTVRVQ